MAMITLSAVPFARDEVQAHSAKLLESNVKSAPRAVVDHSLDRFNAVFF